jgi:hypothetical protein
LCEDPNGAKIFLTNVQPSLDLKLMSNRLSLLELAVWKYCCQKCQDEPPGNYIAWKQWNSKGWKKMKSTYRPSNDINIIMLQVTSYLVISKGLGNKKN